MTKPGKGPGEGLTEKQEAFALAYFETGNAAEAYRRAYDVSENTKDHWIYVEASQLLDHPKVSLRLKGLREQAEAAAIYGRLQAAEEYERAREVAEKVENPSAMVSAITGKVKLFGLDNKPRRLEHVSPDGSMTPQAPVSIYQLPDNGRDATD